MTPVLVIAGHAAELKPEDEAHMVQSNFGEETVKSGCRSAVSPVIPWSSSMTKVRSRAIPGPLQGRPRRIGAPEIRGD